LALSRRFRVDFRVHGPRRAAQAPGGQTLEFKRDLSAPEGALKTIIAFANTAGGTLVVGVEDWHVRGVHDPLALEESLHE